MSLAESGYQYIDPQGGSQGAAPYSSGTMTATTTDHACESGCCHWALGSFTSHRVIFVTVPNVALFQHSPGSVTGSSVGLTVNEQGKLIQWTDKVGSSHSLDAAQCAVLHGFIKVCLTRFEVVVDVPNNYNPSLELICSTTISRCVSGSKSLCTIFPTVSPPLMQR